MFEHFGAPAPGESIRVELLERPPMTRYWFVTENQSELIQVQQDRFAFNWRKMPEAADYPRYPQLRKEFESRLREFLMTVGEGATPTPNWCEVAYINHIGPEGENGDRPELDRLLRLFQSRSGEFPPTPEDTQLVQRFLIPNPIPDDSTPIGRMTVTLASAFRVADMVPIYVLTLVARGRAMPEEIDGALSFLDLGHQWIVRAFEGITTNEMHTQWKLRR